MVVVKACPFNRGPVQTTLERYSVVVRGPLFRRLVVEGGLTFRLRRVLLFFFFFLPLCLP